jgi:hypothetical protein
VVDFVEARGDVRIKDIFFPFVDARMDRLDGVVASSARAETVAVRLEGGFSLGLERHFGQRLLRSVLYGWDSERSLFPGLFGYVDPPDAARAASDLESLVVS